MCKCSSRYSRCGDTEQTVIDPTWHVPARSALGRLCEQLSALDIRMPRRLSSSIPAASTAAAWRLVVGARYARLARASRCRHLVHSRETNIMSAAGKRPASSSASSPLQRLLALCTPFTLTSPITGQAIPLDLHDRLVAALLHVPAAAAYVHAEHTQALLPPQHVRAGSDPIA